MPKLPDASFGELAVHLEGAAAGAHIAIGFVRAEPFAKSPGVKAEIDGWEKDAEIAQRLARAFRILAAREDMIRVFLDTIIETEELPNG